MNSTKAVYDITPAITPDLSVWPGDTPFSSEVICHINEGASVTLSTIKTTVHLGAHVDAPMHYHQRGESIGERSLNYYIGNCQVIHIKIGKGETIKPCHLENMAITAERVLFSTNTFNNANDWNDDFAAISPELVDELHSLGVILIGIDTPSIDLMNSKELPAHKAILGKNMAVLEGISLKEVPAGTYELIALPLKLMGVDGSPVRAILRENY